MYSNPTPQELKDKTLRGPTFHPQAAQTQRVTRWLNSIPRETEFANSSMEDVQETAAANAGPFYVPGLALSDVLPVGSEVSNSRISSTEAMHATAPVQIRRRDSGIGLNAPASRPVGGFASNMAGTVQSYSSAVQRSLYPVAGAADPSPYYTPAMAAPPQRFTMVPPALKSPAAPSVLVYGGGSYCVGVARRSRDGVVEMPHRSGDVNQGQWPSLPPPTPPRAAPPRVTTSLAVPPRAVSSQAVPPKLIPASAPPRIPVQTRARVRTPTTLVLQQQLLRRGGGKQYQRGIQRCSKVQSRTERAGGLRRRGCLMRRARSHRIAGRRRGVSYLQNEVCLALAEICRFIRLGIARAIGDHGRMLMRTADGRRASDRIA